MVANILDPVQTTPDLCPTVHIVCNIGYLSTTLADEIEDDNGKRITMN